MLIKICGLTREEDVKQCLDLGVDLLGYIFEKRSPRCIDPETVAAFPGRQVCRVGVFVRHSLQEIQFVRQTAGLDLIQLHGDYSPAQCEALDPETVVKVFWPERYAGPEDMGRELERFAPCCRYFLFDGGQAGGGHGRTLRSAWLARLDVPRPWFLAGGLCAENVQNFLQECKPDGLDMNSGVENRPGVKNSEKLKLSVRTIRRRET